jgi:hypothetical protein
MLLKYTETGGEKICVWMLSTWRDKNHFLDGDTEEMDDAANGDGQQRRPTSHVLQPGILQILTQVKL